MKQVIMQYLLLALLSMICHHSYGEHITLTDGGYENVVITVSPYISPDNAQQTIRMIEEMVIEASTVLHKATNNYLYFKSVQILVPESWEQVLNVTQDSRFTYVDGDIHIDVSNSIYGDQPHTKQSRGCGQPGDYIQLTPEYLTNDKYVKTYGPRGKVLVHEWAKYRWGVFDEIGYASDRQYPLFYPVEGGYKPTFCADEDIQGQEWDIKSGYSACTLDEFGMPDENCRFIPDATQTARSSLQSFTHLNSIDSFCDSESSRPHNRDAPTKQNILCNRQSVWEVMKKHSDFDYYTNRMKLDINKKKSLLPAPEITTVRQSQVSYCLVLDYSGSMQGNRINKLVTTAQRWIRESVADNSLVGIVKFASGYEGSVELTHVKDRMSRELLANFITDDPAGGTCIGCGILHAIRHTLENTSNGVMILISDGEENRPPSIADTEKELLQSGIRVITVAVGSAADDKLENLAKMTNGKSYYVKDGDQGVMLDDAFQEALVYQPSQQTLDAKIKIYKFNSDETELCKFFSVDSSIGRDLAFRITSSLNFPIEIILTSPKGDKFIGRNSNWDQVIPDAEVGYWDWCIKSEYPSHDYSVDVTTKPRDNKMPPISVDTWVEDHNNYMIIYTKVEQGARSIVKANVEATIRNVEDGTTTRNMLKDNGQGADITANDGIYSKYFTKLVANARFSVDTKVWSDNETLIARADKSSRLHNRGKRGVPVNVPPVWCCGSTIPINENNFESVEPFQRYSSGVSIQVFNATLPENDTLAPNRVTDLKVIDTNETSITLRWTAPGDDLDVGIVSGYTIKMSSSTKDLVEENFNSGKAITLAHIHHDNTSTGSTVVNGSDIVILDLKMNHALPPSSLYYIALVSYDENDNYSPVSALAYLKTPEIVNTSSGLQAWIIILIVVKIIACIVLVGVVIMRLRKTKYEKAQNL